MVGITKEQQLEKRIEELKKRIDHLATLVLRAFEKQIDLFGDPQDTLEFIQIIKDIRNDFEIEKE